MPDLSKMSDRELIEAINEAMGMPDRDKLFPTDPIEIEGRRLERLQTEGEEEFNDNFPDPEKEEPGLKRGNSLSPAGIILGGLVDAINEEEEGA